MKYLLSVIVLAAVFGAGWWYLSNSDAQIAQNPRTEEQKKETAPANTDSSSAAKGEDNLVEFSCADGKKITAVFIRETVGLTLSDGRQMELQQEMSQSGIKYVGAGGGIEFRGEGDEAFLIEGGSQTYSKCISSRL